MSGALTVRAQQTLERHGRTFRQAQVFLPRASAEDAAVIYLFCREADDLADEAPDPAAAREALDGMLAELRGERAPGPVVAAFLEVMERRGGSREPAIALVDAIRGDLEPVRVADDAALLRYAWGVAGTVGLLMAPVLGTRAAEAAGPAQDLGIAMQITNICRDVREDALRGRVYLPATRLLAHGVRPEEVLTLGASREAVAAVVLELLDLADRYYASAKDGYRFLPWRARLCVAVAGAVYRRIGLRLREVHGGDALVGRTVVPTLERIWTAAGALLGLLAIPRPRTS